MSEEEALIKLISLTGLYKCRTHWIQAAKKIVGEVGGSSWPEADYVLIEKIGLLKTPMMHLLIQEELSRDIAFELSFHGLMQDICRNLPYISRGLLNSSDFVSNKPNGKILEVKKLEEMFGISNKQSSLDAAEYDTDVKNFYHLLCGLLTGLGANQLDKEAILTRWKLNAATEVNEGLSTESFIFSGINFLNKLNRTDPLSNKLFLLLALLRQKMYQHPMLVIHEMLSDIPLEYQYEDPKRLMQFNFLKNGVEFHTSIKAIPSQNELKWLGKEIKCSPCEIEIFNTMRSNDKKLNSWSSELEIRLNIPKSLNDKKIPSNIQRLIIDPLEKVGFKINVRTC